MTMALAAGLVGCSSSEAADESGGGEGGAAGAGGGAGSGGSAGAAEYTFEEFAWLTEAPDVTVDRLCDEAADPDAAPDTTYINCRMEGDDLAAGTPEPKSELVVMAYNLERGLKLDDQIAAFLGDPALPIPDILLASEVDRGCSRTADRDVSRELASALGMNYVFATEFVELPRVGGSGGTIDRVCEHGNAVFSRYPLGNAEAFFHRQNLDWFDPLPGKDEPRLGGRVLLKVDVKIGDEFLHVYTLHFESELQANAIQVDQAVEAAEHGLTQPFRVVQGGDTNAPAYWINLNAGGEILDETILAYLDRGYVDAHASVPAADRPTRGAFVLDILFANGDFTSAPSRCADPDCGELSDHLPVWATVALD